MAARRQAPKAPSVIERFIKALVVTHKAVSLYPPSSNIPRDTARDAIVALRDALQERSELRISVSKNGLFYNEVPIFPEQSAYSSFAFELYNRRLADVRFHAGADERDLVLFLSVLKYSPAEVESSGGFESRLWDLGVGAITVTEAHVSLVDGALLAGAESGYLTAPPLERKEIDELLAAAYGGRSRDQLTIARFVGDPTAVATYLADTVRDGEGVSAAADRFAELAQIAYEFGGDADRIAMFRSLGAALEELDPDTRRALLVDEVLPEARTNDSLAAIIRQLDIDSVCHLLVEGIEDGEVSRNGLARAIRNLALISMADREDVMSAAGAAMLGAGMPESAVSEVLELAAPSKLHVRGDAPVTATERPADTIFKLMDLAPAGKQVDDIEDDPGIADLQQEARRGITDGDVIMALVSLVGLDSRDAQFASTMSMLEDSLDLLIDRGELDIAADSADALASAAQNPALTPEQQDRVRRAIGRFSKPGDIRTVAHALRLYKPGSVEHDSAKRLIEALGPAALGPLIEQLADEPDMAVRKSLVDLLSDMATERISEIGAYVSDHRWYVVRNVISVLGSTRSSAVLPYLERTVRHAEPRVRRETIRALASLNDRLAHEMLIAALTDDDANNVQLAARYLGATGVRGAVRALEQVAKGEGRGNRETGPRVEAIEALGRLGATEAMSTLDSLAGKRAIINAARAREIRAAAESAIARIRLMQQQGGAS